MNLTTVSFSFTELAAPTSVSPASLSFLYLEICSAAVTAASPPFDRNGFISVRTLGCCSAPSPSIARATSLSVLAVLSSFLKSAILALASSSFFLSSSFCAKAAAARISQIADVLAHMSSAPHSQKSAPGRRDGGRRPQGHHRRRRRRNRLGRSRAGGEDVPH